jgi:large subunit ribosomal protein L1
LPEKTTVDAVKTALEKAKQRKFKESVEIAINLKDVDLSNPKNRIDEEVILPKGRGGEAKIAVICSGELAVKAKKSADLVIAPEQIGEYADDKKKAKKLVTEYTFFIAEAPLMPTIGKRLGAIMGPRGKMPRPIPQSADPAPLIQNLRMTIKVRTRDRPTFHALVGSREMDADALAENIEAVLKRIMAKLERGKMNIRSAYVKTSMGPAVRLM